MLKSYGSGVRRRRLQVYLQVLRGRKTVLQCAERTFAAGRLQSLAAGEWLQPYKRPYTGIFIAPGRPGRPRRAPDLSRSASPVTGTGSPSRVRARIAGGGAFPSIVESYQGQIRLIPVSLSSPSRSGRESLRAAERKGVTREERSPRCRFCAP
jgi:hypothetical protein